MRRLKLPKGTHYAELVQEIMKLFALSCSAERLNVKYRDGDGDKITVRTDKGHSPGSPHHS